MRSVILLSFFVVACGGGTDDTGDSASAVAVPEFGADLNPQYTVVGTQSDGLATPRDLGFHPRRNEVWVVNRLTDGVVIYSDPGTPEQLADEQIDSYANHFMEEVSSMAWGDTSDDDPNEEAFGSCQESRNTYDGQGIPNDFMGPTLWPGDRSVFAKANQNSRVKLGSHLDMLHASPMCMGIAHDSGNAYWVFDGRNGHLVYYDYQADHGPGGDFHGDGIIRRYSDVELNRKKDIPGHLQLDKETGLLYIADTGTGRVLEVDTATGSVTGNIPQTMEPLEEYSRVEGTEFRALVEGLDRPSGLVLHGDTLFVGEYGTAQIIAFNLDGEELGRIQTTADSLFGLEVGPDGHLWYVDGEANELVRVDPN